LSTALAGVSLMSMRAPEFAPGVAGLAQVGG
jgi:hypothetical protein